MRSEVLRYDRLLSGKLDGDFNIVTGRTQQQQDKLSLVLRSSLGDSSARVTAVHGAAAPLPRTSRVRQRRQPKSFSGITLLLPVIATVRPSLCIILC